MVMPDGIRSVKEADAWHANTIGSGTKSLPPATPRSCERWFLRCQDLIDKYQPDLLYFDDTELPLGQAGLEIAAHYYNANQRQAGRLEAVLTAKGLKPEHGGSDGAGHRAGPGRPDPCRTLADRHLHRRLALRRRPVEQHRYKSAHRSSRCWSTSSARTATCC